MSNWWEAYPVVSADALSQPETDQAVAVADKPAQVDEKQQGNWWEAYPAMRADVGPKALLAGIEDDRKRQEEQAKLHEAHQSIDRYGEVAATASQVVTDTASIAERLIGMGERADEVNRDSSMLDQAMSERDRAAWRADENPDGMSTLERAGQYVPFLKQGLRGAVRSLGSALLGAKGAGALTGAGKVAAGAATGAARGAAAAGVATGAAQGAGAAARGVLAGGATEVGAYGAIGLASSQQANKAITEGADAGLTGSALAGYVASQGVIEAIPATLMQKLGLGGVEAMVAGPAIRGGIKAGFIAAIKATGQEIPEELETELLSAVSSEWEGVDKEALDPDRLSSLVADTVLQTVLMSAGAGAMQTASGAAQARLERLQAMRAKGFVSAEDAAKEGIEGKNRKERLANADKQIEELTLESVRPTVGQTTPAPTVDPASPPAASQPGATPTQTLPNPAQESVTIKPGEQQSPSSVREQQWLEDQVKAGKWSKSEEKDGALVYSPIAAPTAPVATVDPERDQVEDELAGLLGEDTPEPKPTSPDLPLDAWNGNEINAELIRRGISPEGNMTRQREQLREAMQSVGKPSTAGPSEGSTKPTTVPPVVSPDAPAKPETSMGETAGKNQPSEARADEPLRAKDKFTDAKGQQWLVHISRNGVVVAHPVIDGKPQVNQSSGVSFAIDENSKLRNPEYRTDIQSIEKWDEAAAAAEPDADIVQAISNFKNIWGMEATATPADKLSPEQQEALDFATSRGQKMAFVDIAKSDKKAPIGSFQRNEKVVLISNELKGDKLWGMIGHEMAHSKGLDEILPADSAELKTMMDEYFQSASPDVQKRLKTSKRDHQREGRARMVQKFFEDKAFRDQLKQDNPTLWEKLREAVLKFVGKWTPKDEAKRMLLDELRAAPKPEKIKGRKPSGSDKPESGLTKPESTGEQNTGTTGEQDTGAKVGSKPTDFSVSGQSKPIPGMESEEATYVVHNRKPDAIPDTFSVVVAGKPRGKGWTTVKGTGMSAQEAYDRAVRMFTDKRAAEPTPASADQVNVDSGAESKVKPEANKPAKLGRKGATKKPSPEPTGESNWRKEFDAESDPYKKTQLLRQLANMQSNPQELSDILDRVTDLEDETNIRWAVGLNPAATEEVISRAESEGAGVMSADGKIPRRGQSGEQLGNKSAKPEMSTIVDKQAKPTPASADQVNVDSGEESKVKPAVPEDFELVAPGETPEMFKGSGMRTVPSDKWVVLAPSGAQVGEGSTAEEAIRNAAKDEELGDRFKPEAPVEAGNLSVDEFADIFANPEQAAPKPKAKKKQPSISDDDVADRLFDIQDGDSLDLPLWRAGEANDTQGAFYSPRSERSLRYGRKAERTRVRLKSVVVGETKEDVAKKLKVQAEFYDAQDNATADQDPDVLSDIVLKEAAQKLGYDGIVFRMDGMGSPEVYAFPATNPKKTGEKKTSSEGVQEGLNEAKAGADLIMKGLKDLGSNFFSGPPINRDIAVGMGMMANGLIKAGKYKFIEFIDQAVEMLGAPAVRYLGPYLEAGWNKKAESDNRLDKATSVADYLSEPEASKYGTLEAPNRVELGKYFQQQLESGKDYKSIVEARKEAATLIAGEGVTIEPGTPAAKAIDEAVEQGVVRAAREIAESSSDPLKVFDNLLDLYERQPRLAVRTGTSMREQAYSTPAPAAWIATILSDTSRDNTAYDSSAGNGMLLLGVDPENAMANELNPDRAEALRELGYDVHEGDATEYTPDTPPERIIINPPFGELEGQSWTIDGTTTDKIDHAIVLKTLESLPEDGKAVLIIGSKGFEQRKAKDELRRGEAYKNDKNFYNALYDGYNVTDHFTLHGDLYAKQGAAFPIDVIVIDGRGESALPKPYQIDRQNAIPRVINSWKELRDVGERYLDTGSGRPSDLSTEPVGDDMAGLSSLLEGQGERTGGKGGRSGKNTGGRGGVPSGGTDNTQQPRGDSGSSSVSGAPDQQGASGAERLPDDNQSGSTARPDGGNDAKKLDREADVGSEDGLQLPYSQRSSARNVGTLVPATHARAVQEALEKAELRYGNLDKFVAKELGYKPSELMNYFSAEQIDALALNIARHKEGKAFVLGDQTGVGKGRVAAATMVYAKRQGLVPVFMTQSPDLFADMYRDLQDIGQHSEGEPFYALATNTLTGKDKIELPDGTTITQTADFAKDTINEVARNVANDLGPMAIITVQKTTDADGNPLGTTPTGRPRVRSVQEQREYDAVFSTYSQMQTVGGDTKDRHTAMSIIASKAFFVLDESHNAGGVKAKAHDDHTADVSRAARLRELVSESQGVLFLSATYAKNPDVMDLYAKTGMADAIEGGNEALIDTINKGGIPLQQVLSEMLVESGAYMRREKSFDGIEFSAVVKETGREEAGEIAGIFDSINTLDKIKNDIVKADEFRRWLTANGFGLGKDSATGRRGMESSTFSSIVHNLVDQMLLSVKADAVADEAIASLERGESPVIALSNTAGAALDNYLAEFPAEVGDEIEFGFNSTAYRYLERSREITLTDVDASGKRTSRRVRLPDDVLGPDGVQAYNAAKALIDSFAADIPASPIDHIRNRLEKAGYKVAEITGRDMMVDYSGSQMRLARRPSSEQGKSGKLASVRGYNSGEIDALILNQSGSTGLSAHASDKFINQKRRIMIVAQADKNIDTFMQMLGRINRTGQVEQHKGQPKGSNLPRYMLLMTDVPAEIRPASVLIKKLSSLNANVTADSKGSVSFDAPDILNKVGDRVVAEYVADNPALNHALDDIVEVNAEGSPKVFPDIARKVSGRMAMRPIPEQQAFWDAVTETYAEEIEQLNKLGKNPLAATKLDLGARTLERVEIFSGDTTADSPFLQPAYADRALVKKQGEPMTPDEIKTAINQFYGLRTKRKRGPDPFGDMAAEMFRESMTGKDAPQNVTVSQPNLRQAITSWSSEQIAKAEEAISEKSEQQIARLVNQEAIDRVRSRASTIETTIRRRLNSIAPGMAVTVSEALEEGRYSEPITGVVIDVKAKKGNEHLPSGWIATIAISSPDRVVRVPFSRIETAAQAGDMYVAPMFEVAGDLTYAEWEEIGDVYEERVIGTGNVLAAFDKLVSEGDRGNIVFFTNEEGVSQRGVLMPRSFNFDRWAEKRPATFKTPEQVFEFINLEQGQLNHQANDPNFAIQFVMDGQTMLVRSPRSRQRSGKYTTNQELIAASGTDFVSVGQILQMKVRGKQQQLAVIKAALKLGPLVAANFKEDAKAVISRLPATQDASTKTKLQQAAEKANQDLSNAVDELGNVIKGKLGMNLPLNPEVIAAAAKVVAKAIQAGTLNFAELMERMVTKYGEKMAERMRGVLQQEWDKQVNARPYSEDGTPPTSPQPHPELVQPEPIPITSVKNAIVDELRIQRGETPMSDVTPQTVQQWLEVAENRISNDPYAGNTLVEQLLTGNKTSVDELDGMVLQYHYRAVNNLFVEADIKLRQAKANGDPALIATAQDEARVIMRRLTAVETALDKAGTAWGRAGVSRQIFLKQDFSLASMVRRARVANGGNELSDEQVAKISEQAKQIEEMQKRIAELEAKTAEQEQAKVIDEAIKKDIENIQSPPAKPKSKMRLKAEERVASALAMFGAAAKGKLYSNPIDPEVLIPAIEVVKAYFDLGVVTFREFMSTIAKNIGAKEAKASKAIFRTAWDQLQTAGALSQPDLDLTNPGKLTRFARSVQRTLIENGIREREEIVDGVHEALQEIIPDITRRQAMDALSSYGQFSQLSKDPIDQIMRDINGQLQQLAKLEDMEQGIAPAKTGVERRLLSDEERRLAQMVNEATRRGGFVVTDPETQLKSAMAAAKTAVRNRIADMNFELTPKPDGTYSRIVRGKTELIPDAELEQLRKDRDALQQVHKAMFPPKGATQAQKIASASRALDAAIASLEAKLAAGDISPAPQAAPLSTPELDAKRARLKALHDQRNALRKIANPGMTDEQKKILALDKSIAELEKQLSTGNFAPKPKPTPLTSPEINARQAKLEELRATKKAILAAANPKMTPEQRASRAYEAHLRKQLAMYLEKIAQGDFEQKPKKQPRVLTKGELDLKKQFADVKHDFFEALAKYHLDNLSPMGRAIDIVRESAHLSRAIMTSIDLSAIKRQGGLGVYSHPVMARKAAGEMWHAIWSREAEFQSMERLRSRPNAQLYEESGLNITDSEGKLTRQEEAFMGRWARTGVDFAGSKVQAASKLALEPVAASARAYVTFINNLRADLFDVMVENLGQGGAVTKEEAKVIASYINVATGRSDLKSLNDKAAAVNTVFFAPRYVVSRFQYLAMPFYLMGSKDSARVKRLIAMEYARTFTGAMVYFGALTVLAYLAAWAADDDEEKPSVEFNPLSSDFGKVRIDETRLDPMAGLDQVIVFSARMASFRTKNSETGKIEPFYKSGPYEKTHASELYRFLRTKFAPVPSAVATAFHGMKNVVGEDVTPAELVGGLFVPISVSEIASTMQHRGIPKGLALDALNIIGDSVNTYGPKTSYIEATPEERAKQVKDYIKYMNWESDLPAFSQYLKPEELKQVQDRQDERRGDLVFEAMGKVKPKGEYKTEVHYEEALERHEKAKGEFEEFRKQYAPTYADALRYLTHHFDDEGGVKVQGANKLKPSFIERRDRLAAYYQSQ